MTQQEAYDELDALEEEFEEDDLSYDDRYRALFAFTVMLITYLEA